MTAKSIKLELGKYIFFDDKDVILTVTEGYLDIFLICLCNNVAVKKQISLGRFSKGTQIPCFKLHETDSVEEFAYRLAGRINNDVKLTSEIFHPGENLNILALASEHFLNFIFSITESITASRTLKYISINDTGYKSGSYISSKDFMWIANADCINNAGEKSKYWYNDNLKYIPVSPKILYAVNSDGVFDEKFNNTGDFFNEKGISALSLIIKEFYNNLRYIYQDLFEIEKQRFNQHILNKSNDLTKCSVQSNSVMANDDLLNKVFGLEGSAVFFEIIRIIAKEYGIRIKQLKFDLNKFNTYSDYFERIGRENNFFTREVKLPDNWWQEPGLSFVGFDSETLKPLGVIAKKSTYFYIDPGSGEKQKVKKSNSKRIFNDAFTMHPTLGKDKIKLFDILKLGLLGNAYNIIIMLLTGAVLALLGTLFPIATNKIISDGIYFSDISFTMNILIVLIFASIGAMLFEAMSSLCLSRIDTRASTFLQSALIDRLFKLPIGFFKKYSSGDLTDRVYSISSIQAALLNKNISAFLGVIFAITSLYMMFLYAPQLAVLGVVIAILSSLISLLFSLLRYKYIRKETEFGGAVSGLAFQIFNGVSKLKIMDREALGLSKWGEKYSDLASNSYKSSKLNIKIGIISGTFSTLTSIIIYSVIGTQIHSNKPVNVADFIAFMSAFGQFSGALGGIVGVVTTFITLKPVYNRMKPIFETLPEINESSTVHTELTGNLEIHNMSFKYSDDTPYIFKNLNLKINPGEFVAIVGESGCGKSTLTRIILGLEKPEQGTVSFDGYNLEDLNLRELRHAIGVVNQNAKVMPGSIYENITGGGRYSKEQAWKAAYIAGLLEDIKSFPMQMETLISENGSVFSGGQIQRIIIARAMIKNPRVVILDEATSALDNKTQQVITNNLNQMKVTRIVIAHRLSTIKHADRILFLKDGNFIESGSYDELIEKKGVFYSFAKRQLL